MKNKWLALDKASGLIKRLTENVTDNTAEDLKNLERLSNNDVNNYKKRKLVALMYFFFHFYLFKFLLIESLSPVKKFSVSKGPKFSTQVVKLETEITAEMIAKLIFF